MGWEETTMMGNACPVSSPCCSCLQAVNEAASRVVAVMPAIHVRLFIICFFAFPTNQWHPSSGSL